MHDLDRLSNKGKPVTSIEKLFGNRDTYHQVRNITFLFNNTLLLEPESSDPKFIKWLMDKKGLRIKKSINSDGFLTNYDFSCETTEERDNNTIWNITRNFKTTDGEYEE